MVASKIICRIVGHKRSKRAAKRSGETWRSECIFCHTPMLRIAPKNWKVVPVKSGQHQH